MEDNICGIPVLDKLGHKPFNANDEYFKGGNLINLVDLIIVI